MAWAVLHRSNPDFDSSFYFLKRAYELDPKDPLTNMNLVYHYADRLGLHQVAIPFLEDAIKGDPLDPDYYRWLGICYFNLGQNKESQNAFLKSYELTDEPFSGDRGLIYGLINYGELEKAQTLLKDRPQTDYNFLRSFLSAAKGETSKIDTAFSKSIILLLKLNKNKVIKDLIPRIDKAFDQQKLGNPFQWNYDVLKNNTLFKQYQEDPDFKKLLAKAKAKQDAFLTKYRMVKVE